MNDLLSYQIGTRYFETKWATENFPALTTKAADLTEGERLAIYIIAGGPCSYDHATQTLSSCMEFGLTDNHPGAPCPWILGVGAVKPPFRVTAP